MSSSDRSRSGGAARPAALILFAAIAATGARRLHRAAALRTHRRRQLGRRGARRHLHRAGRRPRRPGGPQPAHLRSSTAARASRPIADYHMTLQSSRPSETALGVTRSRRRRPIPIYRRRHLRGALGRRRQDRLPQHQPAVRLLRPRQPALRQRARQARRREPRRGPGRRRHPHPPRRGGRQGNDLAAAPRESRQFAWFRSSQPTPTVFWRGPIRPSASS